MYTRFFVLLLFALSLFQTAVPVVAGQDHITDFLSDDFYDEQPDSVESTDPLEYFNRGVFTLNDRIYTWVLEPVARGYGYVVPSDFRESFKRFFNNLEAPVRFANTVLQGRFLDAGTVFVRFLMNSTVGIYGLADVAAREFDFAPVEASLGETLETWGLGDGCYLVVPFFGPSTLRDFSGTIVDSLAMTPYYTWNKDLGTQAAIFMGKNTNKLSFHLGEYEELKKVTFDPYVAIRNAYFQYRAKQRGHVKFNGMDE